MSDHLIILVDAKYSLKLNKKCKNQIKSLKMPRMKSFSDCLECIVFVLQFSQLDILNFWLHLKFNLRIITAKNIFYIWTNLLSSLCIKLIANSSPDTNSNQLSNWPRNFIMLFTSLCGKHMYLTNAQFLM